MFGELVAIQLVTYPKSPGRVIVIENIFYRVHAIPVAEKDFRQRRVKQSSEHKLRTLPFPGFLALSA